MDRNKNLEEDFYEKVNASFVYTDDSFPINDALYFADGSQEEQDSTAAEKWDDGELTWLRISDRENYQIKTKYDPNLELKLFGSEGIRPDDLK
jgi:hypothetical protein